MPKVCVLMSTYNGEKYIKEQINSILQQEDVDIHIIVRDDGSKDNTVNLLNEYKEKITLVQGQNIGCEKSFMELLYYKYDADYYAYSDQDDYWNSRKVIEEIRAIEFQNKPALSACNLLACDENLQPIRIIHSEETILKIKTRMKNCVVCNMHGCVLLWNKMLHLLLQEYRPKIDVPHDVWVNSVANITGTVAVLSKPLIRYRLHSNNVSGYALNRFTRIKKGLRSYFGVNHPKRDLIAKEIIIGYGDYLNLNIRGKQNICILADYKKNFSSKTKLLCSEVITRYPFPERIFWMICVLLEKY